jgi:membrane protein
MIPARGATHNSPRLATHRCLPLVAGVEERMDTKTGVKTAKALLDRQREHNVSLVAAGLAFYGMLTLIPALVALVSIYGLVSDPAEVTEQVTDLTENLPVETARFVQAQLLSVANGADAGLGFSALVAIGIALWSTSGAMAALIKAIGIAWGDTRKRSIVQIRGSAVAMTAVTVIAAAVTLGLAVVIPQLASDLGDVARLTADALRWLVLFALVVVALTFIYRFAPTSKEKRVRFASPGGVFATVVIVIGSFLFSTLVPRFGSFNETYGALAGIILLLLWLYLCGFAVVLGAELDAYLAPNRTRRKR